MPEEAEFKDIKNSVAVFSVRYVLTWNKFLLLTYCSMFMRQVESGRKEPERQHCYPVSRVTKPRCNSPLLKKPLVQIDLDRSDLPLAWFLNHGKNIFLV